MTEESTNGHGEYEIPENERVQPGEEPNIAAEFAALGKRFGEALQQAWQSEERHRLQGELRDGLDRFAKEVDAAIKDLRKSDVGQRVEDTAQQTAEEVRSSRVAGELRRTTVTALRSLSEALDRMASSFTPYEEGEAAEEPGEETPPQV